MKTQKSPAKPPLRSPTLSDLFAVSNADTGKKSTALDRIHQDKFPGSHVYGYEAQGRKKAEVPLVHRSLVTRR